MQIDGTILAPNKIWTLKKDSWIDFTYINGLTIDGLGKIKGQGNIWWDCRAQKVVIFSPHLNIYIYFI